MRFSKKILGGVLILSVLLTSYSVDFTCYAKSASKQEEKTAKKADDRIIPDGIKIGEHDVSGLSVSKAEKIIEDSFAMYDTVHFSLSANGKSVNATGKDLCICPADKRIVKRAANYGKTGNMLERFKATSDIESGRGKTFELVIGADKKKLKQYIKGVSKQFNDVASDNTLVKEGNAFVFKEGKSGVVLDEKSSVQQIADFLSHEWDGKDAALELPTMMKEPRGTKEELSQITDLLGSYSTDFSSSAASRANNVSNGARLINGTILFPGDEFSVLDTITPFNEENGYQLAGSYENGTTVETFGGGICQVSSTLYGAVRQAELEVVTRSCHSMVINYVQPSQDAAISESGSKDFQIKNNKNYPVLIEGYTNGGIIYFNIYGKEEDDPSHSVDYETEITEVKVQNTTWVASETLPLGQMSTSTVGHTGYKAKLWKVIYENGEEVDRYVYNNSTYNPSNRTVVVGVATPDASLKGAMINAVSTQNPDAIAAAVATLAPGAYNPSIFTIKPKYEVTVKEEDAADGNASTPEAQPQVEQPPVEQPPAEAPLVEGNGNPI